MELTTFILLVLVAIAIWKTFSKGRIARMLDELPGPKGYPIFGNILELVTPKENLTTVIENWDKKHGPIYAVWFGPLLGSVHIMKPEYVETILSSNKYIKKSIIYEFLHPWLGTGLLTSTGDKWFKHRKLLTPSFHFQVLDNFVDVFNTNSRILVEKLGKLADTDQQFDIYPFITLAALDIICESSMGTKVNAQKNETSNYVTSLYKIHERARKLSRMTRQTEESEVDETGRKRKKAFLDMLLDAAEGMTVPMTDEELREEVDTFMFEGHDTTTVAICWTIMLLGNHPEIQDKVYEEQKSIFGEDMDRQITMKDITEMKYLEKVVKESLRMYPSVPFISRHLEEDVTLGEYKIPTGASVTIHILRMHYDPETFPDPYKFDPDRFSLENSKNRHPYSYVPFSAGPRNCIGQKFAMLEEKTQLSYLLRKYKFTSMDKPSDIKTLFELTLRPSNGIRVKISKRH